MAFDEVVDKYRGDYRVMRKSRMCMIYDLWRNRNGLSDLIFSVHFADVYHQGLKETPGGE